MPESTSYPFVAKTQEFDLPASQRRWWTKNRPAWRFPLQISLRGTTATIADSVYELRPIKEGYACRRAGSTIIAGEIYPYGVRRSLTPSLHNELSMLRAVLWDKSYPAPICYDLSDDTRVHPGPCLEKHPNPEILRPCYTLNQKRAYVCVVCGERFL